MGIALRSAANLAWILLNSALINAGQLALFCFVRPFNRALCRRCMSHVQSMWLDVVASCFPDTRIDFVYVLHMSNDSNPIS